MKKKWKTNRGGQAPTNNVCQGGTQFNISGNAQFVNGGTGIQVNGPYYATSERGFSAEGGFSAQRQNGRKEKTQQKQWEPPAVRFLEKAEPAAELLKEPAVEPAVESAKEPVQAETAAAVSEKHPKADSTEKVLTDGMEHDGKCLDSLAQIRKAVKLIDPCSGAELALLLLVSKQAKAVTIGTQPLAFVKMLSREGLLPKEAEGKEKSIAHAMWRPMGDLSNYRFYQKWPEDSHQERKKKKTAEQLYRVLLNLR